MNTTENNKLIAEFMEHKPTFEVYIDDVLTTLERPIKNYNSDWNWLMSVVEKIESLENCQVTIIKNWCRIEHAKYNDRIDSRDYSDDFTKIEAVYNACVTFIEWYNKNAVKS